MRWFANIAYLLAALAYMPILIYQMICQGKNRRGWREKLLGPNIRPPADPAGKRIWIHAVSLGEINATPNLVRLLSEAIPDHEIVISTTTDTGYARACALYGQDRVFRYPLDFSWTINRAIRNVNPALIILVELEIWFNLVTMAAKRNIPVAVVNGRLTERSAGRLGIISPITRRMFSCLTWVGAQDDGIAARFATLGTPRDRISVVGTMKWDTAALVDSIEGQSDLATALGIDKNRPLWVCGSTGPGEESLILDAYDKLAVDIDSPPALAIVPRKPERFDEVASLITSRGYDCRRRSNHPDHTTPPPIPANTIFLGDTMGELRKLYCLADIVFVGRSMVPMGGSDPMEVAALARPVIVGPHMDNFALPTKALADGGGLITVTDPAELASTIQAMLIDPNKPKTMGQAARKVVQQNQGATSRTIEALSNLLR